MKLVHDILDGIASESTDDGARGFGRPADIIRMGRNLWQTDPLPEEVRRKIQEPQFQNRFMPVAEAKAAFNSFKKTTRAGHNRFLQKPCRMPIQRSLSTESSLTIGLAN